MKVLMISTDRKVFDQNSEVRQRMRDYAGLVTELWVLALGRFCQPKIIGNLRLLGLTRRRALFWRPREKFDVVSAQDPFETGFIAWQLARRFGAKFQLQIHTDFLSPYFWQESLKNKIRVLLARFLLPKADGIRVVSERIKQSLESAGWRIKAVPVVLPIFVDLNQIKNSPIKTDLRQKYPQFEKIILMASRLTKEKNIGLAIEAMPSLIRANRRIGLVVVGSGPESEKLKAKSAKLGLEKNIIFENWTNDLPSYYKTADLFLLTSNYEGYGRTLLEAAAAGCQIISTDVGAAREILPSENIVPVNNHQALTEKIILALEGRLPSSYHLPTQTKEEYLRAYGESWRRCFG